MELLETIENIYKKNNGSMDDFAVTQIKEKYGTLHFYVISSISEVENVITQFEEKSERVCEACGKAACLHVKNEYLLTLCDDCGEEKGFEKVKEIQDVKNHEKK